ncbi:hypothetical protein LINPERHAP1_LOCUS28797 [Linum perenne]
MRKHASGVEVPSQSTFPREAILELYLRERTRERKMRVGGLGLRYGDGGGASAAP